MQTLHGHQIESAFTLATVVFTQQSTLHRAMGIQLDEYRNYLHDPFKEMVAEGLSIAAIDDNTGELLGCLVATDFVNQLENQAQPRTRFAPLAALTNTLATIYNRQRSPSAGDAVLVDMGVVSAHAQGRGIYTLMRSAIHDVARRAGYRWILGELSSAATQRVVITRMKHRVVAQVNYDEFEFEGGLPFRSIKDPPSIVLSEGDL